ncbi:unnamed protein product [Closterium sp. NIES-53]
MAKVLMHADPEHRWHIATMTVKEALARWKGKAAKTAMHEEIKRLILNGTWELVERPRGVNIMKNRWLLLTMYHVDDTVASEKARLVVKGFTQVCGADYDETYAPVGSYVTLRIFLSIVAVLDLHLMQLDMKNAFLQSKLDYVLYMYQPDYYNDGTGRVDEALYFKAGDDWVACLVLVYVDDLLVASSSLAMLKELKELLEAVFELHEISPVENYLGLKFVIDRSARRVWLNQQSYVDKLQVTLDDEEAKLRKEEYRQKVGSLQFASTTTRPDIAFACSKLGSGLTVRSDNHWREVDRFLHYLCDTRDIALEFGGGSKSLCLVGYGDADYAGDKQNCCSTNGYVFSEYVAATEAGKEARRLHFLLAEFQLLDTEKPTVIYVDNQSAITVAEGLGLKGNLKHME